MNRDLLYRFFEGTASLDEENQIRVWMEKSETNFTALLKKRKEYDIQLLSGSKTQNVKKRGLSLSPLITVIVAAVLLIFILSGIYLLFSNGNNINQYNTIIVPAGQRINLILSDNTNLWLNANTKFRYPTEFSKDNRTVYLDGEAYFEVSKDEKKPFIVKTGKGDILVTGTSFNVEAYTQFNSFETSLFEGSVEIFKDEIKLHSLKPNQKSTFEGGQFYVTPITDSSEYLWKNGLIAFNNKKLEDILITLEKYFDVNIQIISSNLPQYTYTGKFRQSDGIDYALRVLQKSIHFSYERDEETGKIYIK